jgi:hypothetical protein
MAKLSEDSTLAGVRGKTGGLVVSSNASGGYVRPWFMPRVPRTPEQTAWSAKFGGWVQAWAMLDNSTQGLWETASGLSVWTRTDWFGQPYQPSGFNLWIMVAAIRDSLGLTPLLTPPSGSAPGGVFNCLLTLPHWTSTGHAGVMFDVPGAAGVVYAQVEISPYNSLMEKKPNKPYRPYWAGTYAAATLFDTSTKLDSLIGRVYKWTGACYRWRGLSSTCVPQAWVTGSAHAALV